MAGVKDAVTTARLADFTFGVEVAGIPAEVAEAAKLHMLDTLGCGLAAAATGVGTEARAAVEPSGGPASLIGSLARGTAAEAALANGTLCHALDFDDTHAGAIAHVGTVVVPAAIAAAQAARADGPALLAALVAGSELTIRIGTATEAGFHRRGFHPTSVCGVFGAAVAAARLLGLTSSQAANALGIAGSFAGGIFEYLADGSATKPLHAGWAAHGGLLAAQIARHGGTGPASVLDGRFGIFATHNEGPVDLGGFDTLGEQWESPATAFKAYPCCHYIHGPLDAMRELRGELLDAGGEITAIEAEIPAPGVDLVLDPLESKLAPRSVYEAKFSLPWAVATLFVTGELDSGSFNDEAIQDPDVLALASRFSYRPQEFASFPGAFPGTLRVQAGERTFEATVLHQRGHALNPMSADEVIAKFTANAGLALPGRRVASIVESALALDRLDADGVDALASALEEARS